MVMACVCTANALPSVHVTFPVDHSWWQVDHNASSLGQLGLFFTVDDFQIPGDGYLVVTGQKIQEGHRHESPIRSITFSGVEPGSHFWTLTLFYANGTQVPGPQATTTVHIEVVIPQSENLLKWRYDLTQDERKPTILVNLPVKSFEHTQEAAPLSQALRQLNVSVEGIPLEIARDDLYHAGIDDSKVTATLHRQSPASLLDTGTLLL
ncbi:hypothetical protein Poli38472_010441 [Pythium oligandrum]|uniref:Uncharacterized protein n=1 Tax=Pythium oligandrum TaxID=41045 RepID=A0A8K1FC77_PYTOL|nr:hypothetical protein Poli38472_010441 [Pythium oligandrum]|eukprot:TMW55559.1 hypothetical protein Poli38472_010441 [Pythium oligandrum]